jgi:DHA3 family macrolide efflux protein-like MFS transporter
MILDLTGSKSATGIAATISYLPPLVFGIGAGLLVDRWNRRKVMMASDGARAALLLGATASYLSGVLTPPLLIAIAFGVATASVLFYPARDSMLPELVSKQGLNRANSLVQLSQQAAFFAGPMAAGYLIKRFGVASALPTAMVFFMGSLFALLFLRGAGAAHTAEREKIGLAKDFRTGLKAIAQDRTLVLLLLLTALDNLFIMGPAVVGNAVLVRDTLHADASAYAIVEGTYGIAMIVGSLTVGRLGARIGYGRLLLLGITLDGLTYVPVLFCKTLPFLIAISFVHALAIPMITIPRATLVQGMVPSRLQGRVFALVNVVVLGTTAISSGLAGLVLEYVTAPVLFGWIGFLAGATGLAGFFSERLRRL